MFNPNKEEEASLKAVFVGVFLIVLIVAVTIFNSGTEEKNILKDAESSAQVETINSEKIGKITLEDLAKKIQTDPNLVIIDLRTENQFKAEHIVDSIHITNSKISISANSTIENKTCVLVDASGVAATINTVADSMLVKGCKSVSYLNGGFDAWKGNFNPTINDGDPKSFTDQAKVKRITSDELKKMLETEKNIVIVDVRKDSEFNLGHLAGAINIYLDSLEENRKKLPRGKKIILYDNDNLGSFKAAVRLFDLGFLNTLALSNGLDSWKIKGYEVVK